MQLIIAVVISFLFSCGVYMILQRCFIRILFGFALLSHACNLVLLSMSGNPIGKSAPIITDGKVLFVDPLPQALTLTAIVIGFAVTGFLIVFLYRLLIKSHTTNSEDIFNDVNK